ncbi:MAG: DUF4293 domain-containing protein [Prevotellaceae bacterium]|jgi:hypothetical protein|nr:DUF4293 domain-containing protein [Prevotellaceae bacterium]
MIQRIQSVYLLLVTLLLIAAMCLPVGSFVAPDGTLLSEFTPLGITLPGGTFHYTWGLLAILLLSTLIAGCTLLLYRNRMLQVRMVIFNSILLAGYYVVFVVFMLLLKSDLGAGYHIGWALCLPAVSLILNYLAFRAIYRDEVMVRAADRLR